MQPKEILEFIHHVEGLKHQLRHSWLSDGRQESVAEHTWRMSMMALVMAPKVDVDILKVLKMIAVHDLSENEVGDVPAFKHKEKEAQKVLEKESMLKLKEKYNDPIVDEIYELWVEYEDGSTKEAKFAKALDKLEVRIQHNEAKMESWNDIEYPRSQYVPDKWCDYDVFLKEFNELVKEESKDKIISESSKDFDAVKKEADELKKL